MITTDTTKLFFRNSGLIWRILAYFIVCGLVIGGVCFAVCYPFISNLVEAGVFDKIYTLLTENLVGNVNHIFESLAEIFQQIIDIIFANWQNILPILVLFFILVCVLGSFILALSEMALADCLYGYMGSNSKLGFSNCFIKNLVQSVKLQLAKILVVLPCNIIICVAVACSLMLYFTGNFWLVTFAPFVVILVFTVLYALRNAIFCAWVPCVVVRNIGVWDALRESTRASFKNFGKIFATYFILAICMVAITIAAISLTASVGLIISIPACVLFNSALSMVLYFNINGLKYYIDNGQIITPRKREEWENVYSLKYVI